MAESNSIQTREMPSERVVIEYVDPETERERQGGNGAIYLAQRSFYHDRDHWRNDKAVFAWWRHSDALRTTNGGDSQ